MKYYYEYEDGKFDIVNLVSIFGATELNIASVYMEENGDRKTNIILKCCEFIFNPDNLHVTGFKCIGNNNYVSMTLFLYTRKPRVK